MGLMQRQFNSAISAGMAGYQWSSVWSALQGQNLIMGQVSSQASSDRVVLAGNATEPMGSPSHYTDEKLRSERGPAAGLTTMELVPNGNGTVAATVNARVRRELAARDPALLAREWQHVDRWKSWIGRMNAPNSDLSRAFRDAPWDLRTSNAIRDFLAPYRRNEFGQQKLDYDQKGGRHDVDYGLTE
jgi:hypothetical protein